MLKNRNSLYLLIPLNIAIWSYFAYELFGGKISITHKLNEVKSKISEKHDSTDTFVYHLNYEDPFLRNYRNPEKKRLHNTKSKRQKTLKKPASPKTEITRPTIKYYGLIRKSGSKSSTALVYYNGEPHWIKSKEKLGEIIVRSFNADSMVCLFQKEILVFKK